MYKPYFYSVPLPLEYNEVNNTIEFEHPAGGMLYVPIRKIPISENFPVERTNEAKRLLAAAYTTSPKIIGYATTAKGAHGFIVTADLKIYLVKYVIKDGEVKLRVITDVGKLSLLMPELIAVGYRQTDDTVSVIYYDLNNKALIYTDSTRKTKLEYTEQDKLSSKEASETIRNLFTTNSEQILKKPGGGFIVN